LRKLTLIAFILLAMVSVVSAETLSVPSTIYSQGEVGKPSSFTVNLTVNPTTGHVPIDVVLAMDCSPSMERYSKVIYGPTEVNITKKCGCCCRKWVPIAEFTLDHTSNVEVLLSYSLEDYYNISGRGCDRIDVALDVKRHHGCGGCCGGCKGCEWFDECEDPARFRFEDVPAGTHTIYVKLHGKPRTEMRVLVVALPPTKINATKEVAKSFVGLLKDFDRCAVVRIGSNETTKIELNLTEDKQLINNTIDNLTLDGWICIDEHGHKHCGCCGGGCGGCGGCKCKMVHIYELTSIVAGLEKAYSELKNNGRPDSKKIIILLSDGENNNGGYSYPSPLDVATLCANEGIVIYTIGFGVVNETLLKRIAEITGGKYYYAPSCEDLEKIYNEIYDEIVTYAYNVTLTLNFNNSNVKFDHAIPAPTSVVGNTVSWQWSELKSNTSITVWVNSTIAGEQTVAIGNLTYEYYNFSLGTFKDDYQTFEVIMNFAGNLIVNAVPDKDTIWEGETVNITITANYPISNVMYSAVPEIDTTNSKVEITVSGNTAVFSWTPLYNYIDENTTATITFDVVSTYGLTNSTSVDIKVLNVQNVPPFIVTAKPNMTEIREMETVSITITANDTIADVSYSANPSITDTNSEVELKPINSTAWVMKWTPFYNYVDQNTTAKITFDVLSADGRANSTSVDITVLNVPITVSVPPLSTGSEGELIKVPITVIPPPSDVSFEITDTSPNVTISDVLNKAVLSFVRINETTWIFAVIPQYNFAHNNSTEWFEVTWYANGTKIGQTRFEVRDNQTVDKLPHPIVTNTMELSSLTIDFSKNVSKPVYVGQPAFISVKIINGTDGWIKVNGVNISTSANVTINATFIPNTAGEYLIEAYATDGTNVTKTDVAWFIVRLKPVTPS